MKKDYIKPIVGIVMLASEIIMDENSGVADKPRAKEGTLEVEEETAIPDKFSATAGENVDVTAVWLKMDPLAVTTNAYKPAVADVVGTAENPGLLPRKTKVTLNETEVDATIDWSADRCEPAYGEAAPLTGDPGDTKDTPFVFTGTLTASKDSVTYTVPVTCTFSIAPKTSGDYEYHYDSLATDAKVIIPRP